MLTLCGETEESLAQELLQFEVQMERDVVEPLFVLAEVRPDKKTHTVCGLSHRVHKYAQIL